VAGFGSRAFFSTNWCTLPVFSFIQEGAQNGSSSGVRALSASSLVLRTENSDRFFYVKFYSASLVIIIHAVS
jgi:hypothetical protein